MRKLILLFCFILFFPLPVLGGDATAVSCAADDIQNAIDVVALGGGGTVTLPACDYTAAPADNGALWGSGDRICIASVDDLIFLGQGESTTKMGYADGASPGSTNISCPTMGSQNHSLYSIFVRGVGVKEVGQFTFDINNGGSGFSVYQCVGSSNEERRACTTAANEQRFHHITLQGMAYNGRGFYF